MTRLSDAAGRLSTGSRAYTRRLAARAAAWCARGRRDDLTGWRAALGIIVRLALLALGVYLLARLVRALPSLMWLLTGWWTIAAWRARRPAAEAPQKEPEEAPAAPDVEVVRTLLLDLMGTGSGVHLRTVLAHLQEHGQWEGRKVADLRSHLRRLGVPVDRGVKVAGVPTWGVRRRDLQGPSPAAAQETSPSTSTAA
ncbi:hypothetical protein F3K39_28305 [Streptomyces sp. LBUM 1479]|uniref:hypothetical protein n=1 Tax=Streptomyces scabiei TaxID=1930 RepID=UPI001B33B45D|nr:hypothetical protein [Streptomyces scabiei]MBP5931839.1 hypothetical protein [Streptomyces sp. LBUM 1479]MDX3028281.1 hypothetical protein [Streptomyces scabiei]